MMRTASLISIIIGIPLLITGMIILVWGKSAAIYSILLWLFIFASWIAIGTIDEARKKKLEKERFCVNCGREIPLDRTTCPYCDYDSKKYLMEHQIRHLY